MESGKLQVRWSNVVCSTLKRFGSPKHQTRLNMRKRDKDPSLLSQSRK